MRTTLDIDEDLLLAAKELARRERSTAGRIVSRMLRTAMTGGDAARERKPARKTVAGFEPFQARAGVVTTNEQVDALRESEGI